jgi:hypothetical protein
MDGMEAEDLSGRRSPLDTFTDVTGMALDGFELPGAPPPVPALESPPPRSLYVLSLLDSTGRFVERIATRPCWEDLRLSPPDAVPDRVGRSIDACSVTMVDSPGETAPRVVDSYLGSVYRTADGDAVLTLPRSDEGETLDGFVVTCPDDCCDGGFGSLEDLFGDTDLPVDGLPITLACERGRPVVEDGKVYASGPTLSAAVDAAVRTAQSYADGVALARGRQEECSSPCRSCGSGRATIVRARTTVHTSNFVSQWAGAWRYQARRVFTFTFSVGCCRQASDGTA